MRDTFNKIAEMSAKAAGSSWAFLLAILSMVAWGVTGPVFHYSDTWQLVVNSYTDIVTFLMVFLIQNAQNRDTTVIELKLDELLRGVKGARTSFVELDDMSENEIKHVKKEFARIRADLRARRKSKR
jgi:low affinity Fe/Cu permease